MKRGARCLALALALCLLLGALPARAAFTDDADIENKEAVSLLVILGVASGYDDGSFRPDAPVTRGEIAKMLCLLINGGRDPGLAQPQHFTFTDIAGKWSARYIEYAASIGIVSGYGDGRFGPDDGVTGQQLSKMLLVCLNYDPEVEGLTGEAWAERADSLATQLGFYTGLGESFDSTQPLTREQAAQMLAGALYADRAVYRYSETDGVVSGTQAGSSLMDNNFNAEVLTGVVAANADGWLSETARRACQSAGAGTTVLDTGDTLAVVRMETGLDVLGTAVTAVVQRDTGEAYGYLDAGLNSVVTHTGAATVEESAAALEQAGLTLPASLPQCVNGREAGLYSGSTGGETTRFIDSDGDGVVNLALTIRPYVTICQAAETGGLTLANLPATGEMELEFADGVRIGEPVLCEVYGGVCHVRPCRQVSGELESLSADMQELTIDGVQYSASDLTGALPLREQALNTGSLTLYLDASGDFVAALAR